MDRNTKLALHTGRQMPALGLGTWQLTHDTAGTAAAALEFGYRLIDTAEDYGTQPGIGEGFRRSGLDRSDLYLVAKVEETEDAHDATRAYLRTCDARGVLIRLKPPKRKPRRWCKAGRRSFPVAPTYMSSCG